MFSNVWWFNPRANPVPRFSLGMKKNQRWVLRRVQSLDEFGQYYVKKANIINTNRVSLHNENRLLRKQMAALHDKLAKYKFKPRRSSRLEKEVKK